MEQVLRAHHDRSAEDWSLELWGKQFPHHFLDQIEFQFLPKAKGFGVCSCLYCVWEGTTASRRLKTAEEQQKYVKERIHHKTTRICKPLNEWWYANLTTHKSFAHSILKHNWEQELILEEAVIDTIA